MTYEVLARRCGEFCGDSTPFARSMAFLLSASKRSKARSMDSGVG